MHFQRARRLDRYDLVLAVAVFAFLLSVAGLSMSTLRERPRLPGFARYDGIEVRQDAEPIPVRPVELAREIEATERLAAPVASLSIPSISITATLIPMGVRPDGYMDLPNNPHDIAWYDFTSKPGLGVGNAVFSAHVDYINYGPAVFWNLSKVRPGDGVFIGLRDGATIRYVVTAAETIPLSQLDVASTIAPTDQESITLITCSGEFSQGNYSHRVIVRAVRTTSQRGG